MRLKILHALPTIDPAYGGPVEGVKQLSKINASYGHLVEVVTLDDPASPWLRSIDFPVHALGPGLTSYRFSFRFVSWLRQNRRKYDVVIVNGVWSFNTFGVWCALRHTNTPYYVYTHGMLDPWFKYNYPLKHIKKWLFWPWAVFPVLRDAKGVFFTCEEERRLARESFWLYDCNEIVVSYGTPGVPDKSIDYTEKFLSSRRELANFRRFVFLGRVHPKKGPDIIIKAVAHLQARGIWSSRDMRVIMAGPVDGKYASDLMRLARKLRVEDSFVWTGMLLGPEKWGALSCAEAFLLPSHQENFGIAVAESLSVGVPVLISRSVNIWKEIVKDCAGTAGDDTVSGFADQLENWINLPANLRECMRTNARECFERRFTSRRAAISLLSNIYQIMAADRILRSSP